MKKNMCGVAGLCCMFFLISCGAKMQGYLGIDANLHKRTDEAVKSLLNKEDGTSFEADVFFVTSVVNLSSLKKSSGIGRILSEYIANTLVDMGYVVREIRMDKIISFKKEGGEYILSREKMGLETGQDKQMAITGTYTTGKNVLFVSLHLVDLSNNVVRSTYEFDLPLGSETRVLSGLQPYLNN